MKVDKKVANFLRGATKLSHSVYFRNKDNESLILLQKLLHSRLSILIQLASLILAINDIRHKKMMFLEYCIRKDMSVILAYEDYKYDEMDLIVRYRHWEK